jgi:uncharacterized protein
VARCASSAKEVLKEDCHQQKKKEPLTKLSFNLPLIIYSQYRQVGIPNIMSPYHLRGVTIGHSGTRNGTAGGGEDTARRYTEREVKVITVGVISDTHGLLRPSALEALRGAELILHAGDIGSPQVITGLQALAPVTAVRGNCDEGAVAGEYPLEQRVVVGEVTILLLHDMKMLEPLVPDEGVRVVVTGHTHKPAIQEKDGVLYLNPGSAGRRRFKLPITVALLKVDGSHVAAEIIELVD